MTDAGASSRARLSINGSVVATAGASGEGAGLINAPNDFSICGSQGEAFLGKMYFYLMLSVRPTTAVEAYIHGTVEDEYPSVGALP